MVLDRLQASLQHSSVSFEQVDDSDRLFAEVEESTMDGVPPFVVAVVDYASTEQPMHSAD